jgi:hypothetical protein
MKYLLPLLLLSLICHAQQLPDDVKVTAYRLYHWWHDGPCSIATYVKISQEWPYDERPGTYATAESSDKSFINGLLVLKKRAWKKAKIDYYCGDGGDGIGVYPQDPVPNMFVISGTNIADTLFTDETNQQIFFPDKQMAYFDKGKQLIKSFPPIIKELYDHDFDSQRDAMYAENFDVVSHEMIVKQDEPLKDFLNRFKDSREPFNLIRVDSVSVSEGIELLYTYGYKGDTISFDDSWKTIKVYDKDSDWVIGDIRIGDTEEALKKTFPRSTRIPFICKIRFEDIKRVYYYPVNIKDNNGEVLFYIKDNIVESISIHYYHK